MSSPRDVTERRGRNLRDTRLWDRDLHGYAICPWCGAMIYEKLTDLHQGKCGGAQPERRGGDLQELADEPRKAAEELEG